MALVALVAVAVAGVPLTLLVIALVALSADTSLTEGWLVLAFVVGVGLVGLPPGWYAGSHDIEL